MKSKLASAALFGPLVSRPRVGRPVPRRRRYLADHARLRRAGSAAAVSARASRDGVITAQEGCVFAGMIGDARLGRRARG